MTPPIDDLKTHERFMRRAIELAAGNVRDGKGGPFGALVVRDGRVRGEGVNLVTSANDPTAHAEVVAIREACRTLRTFRLTGCDIYASCEPCPMCLGAIYWAGIRRVYYAGTREDAAGAGFSDMRFYEEFQKPLGRRDIAMIPLLRSEGAVAFAEWLRKKDRIEY